LVNFFPSSTAFNYVFAVGIIMSILNALVALGIRNYRFGQRRDVAEEGKGEVPTIGTPHSQGDEEGGPKRGWNPCPTSR